MIENFIEYMWYLLTTPLKKLKKALNKWYILCRVFGKRFDEAKEDILRARDEGMVATCSHEMLPVHGADRRLTRYEGEHPENFRSRIAMYEEICKLGGTNEGVLLAVRTLGYTSPVLVRANDLTGFSHFTLDGSCKGAKSDCIEGYVWLTYIYIIIGTVEVSYSWCFILSIFLVRWGSSICFVSINYTLLCAFEQNLLKMN